MQITWHGTATLTVESGGTKILFDPFLKRNKNLPSLDVDGLAEANAAFITHPHFDHFCDISAFTDAGLPVVYGGEQCIKLAKENGFSTRTFRKLQLIEPYEEVRVGRLRVTAYPAVHCRLNAANTLASMFNVKNSLKLKSLLSVFKTHRKFPLDEGNTTYAFEVTDGLKRVLILGSAGLKEGVCYPTGSDLLVFPYQGRTKMHLYAMPFIEKLRPKRVLADHFDDAFPPVSRATRAQKLVEETAKRYPSVTAFVPTENVAYEV